jgi:hypothetical protein
MMRAPWATALASCLLAGLAAQAAEKLAGVPQTISREIPLDLPADFSPVLCDGTVHLFSSGGRNQTMAPGESAPACNILPMVPKAQPLCAGSGPIVLTKEGTLWKFTPEGPQALDQDLGGAVAFAPGADGTPAILFSNRLKLSSAKSVELAIEASGLNLLPDGGFWVSGAGSGLRVGPEGTVLWTWQGGLTPTGASMSDGLLAVGTREGVLAVLDAGTGRERYRYPTGGAISTLPRIEGPLAVFGSQDHLVRAVRMKDGQLAWQIRLDGRVDFGPVPTRAGLVFAASAASTVVALDPTDGRRTWTWRLPSGNLLQSPAGSGDLLAILGWGESETPTLYLVGVPEPAKPLPPPGKKKARRAAPVAH